MLIFIPREIKPTWALPLCWWLVCVEICQFRSWKMEGRHADTDTAWWSDKLTFPLRKWTRLVVLCGRAVVHNWYLRSLECTMLMRSYSLLFVRTNSVGQNFSWEDDIHTTSQEIPRVFWNSKFHYHLCKILLLDHVLSQINLGRNITSCFFKTYLNILPSVPRFA
jgi:hypothetical protein